MRISDWSSDVCSSDLHGNISAVIAKALRFVLFRAGRRIKRMPTPAGPAGNVSVEFGGRDSLCHGAKIVSATAAGEEASVLPRRHVRRISGWRWWATPSGSRVSALRQRSIPLLPPRPGLSEPLSPLDLSAAHAP